MTEQQEQKKLLESIIEKPINYKEKVPLISLRINNKEEWFLLDTGASDSCIDVNHEALSGATVVDDDEIYTGFGNSKTILIYEIPIFIDKYMMFQRFAAIPLGIVEVIKEKCNKTISGVIGMDFLEKHKAFIDFYNLNVKLTLK